MKKQICPILFYFIFKILKLSTYKKYKMLEIVSYHIQMSNLKLQYQNGFNSSISNN
jgi:hypothetical protein